VNLLLIFEIILVFVLIMFIHELGHFLLAKRAGIFVREFSLGLGPKLFRIKKGETWYSLRILPFGAYVRMAGEDPEVIEIKAGQEIGVLLNRSGEVADILLNDRKGIKIQVEEHDLERKLFIKGLNDEGKTVTYPVARDAVMHYEDKEIQIAPWDRQFGSKTIKERFAAIFAGPIFNIILAVILFFAVTMMLGVPSEQIMLGEVTSGSPAEQAGLLEGDIIIGVNGDNLTVETNIVSIIQESLGKPLDMAVERNGVIQVITVTPQDIEQTGKGLIGVQLKQIYEAATFGQAAGSAFKTTAEMTAMIFDGFRMIVTGNVSMNDLAGPVGILQITGQAAKQGLAMLIYWAGILSLYLGIFNLLPIPALDGSRLLFLSLEGVRGKPIDPQKESVVHLVGFALLMLLMIVVTVNDVSRFFN